MTVTRMTSAVLMAAMASRGSSRPVLDIAADCIQIARTCDRLGIGLTEEVEQFMAGCLRTRDRVLTREATEDLILLCVDYHAKRSAEKN